MLWPLSVVLVQRTVGYPSTSWASCSNFVTILFCKTVGKLSHVASSWDWQKLVVNVVSDSVMLYKVG